MKKIIVLLLCLIGGSSLLAQENTVLGTGALSQTTTLKYAIQQIQVANPSGYSRPTIDFGGRTVQWAYQYMNVDRNGVYVEGYFTSTTDLGSFVPSIIGGYGSGATLNIYFSDFDGTNYYYEIYSDSQGSGYVPEVTLSSHANTNYDIYTYISEENELHIDYYDYNKTNLYTTAPTVSISFGGATATAILEGTAANGQNTAIGYQALYANSTGRENTALGHQSLYSSTGNSNLGLGYLAGNTLTTGNNNIFIGKNAGRGITTGSGNVVIGNGSNFSLSNGLSNSVVFTDGSGTPRMFIGGNGNTKIGFGYDFNDTGYKLDVNGLIKVRSELYAVTLKPERGVYFFDGRRGYPSDAKFLMTPSSNDPPRFQLITLQDFNVAYETDYATRQTKFFYPVKGVNAVSNDEYVTLGQLASGQTIGANISGNANSATTWNGLARDFSGAPETTGFEPLVITSSGVAKYTSIANLKNVMNIDNGATLSNNVSGSARLWGGYEADFTTGPTGNLVGLLGWSPTDNKYKEFNISAVKSTLGLPISGGFDLQSVTERGNATENNITLTGGGNIIPSLGTKNSKLYIANGNGSSSLYGMQFGVLGTGEGYVQQGRTDGTATAYNLLLNPNGGNVGIGIASPQEKLAVNGKIRAREVKVEPTTNWPDYVFEEGYKPLSLTEISDFIKQHRHLPEVPSAKEVEQNGLELGEMNKILLKKVEELTLHLIEKENQLKETNSRIDELSKMVDKLIKKLDK